MSIHDMKVTPEPSTELQRIAVSVADGLQGAVSAALGGDQEAVDRLGIILIVVRGVEEAREFTEAGQPAPDGMVETGLVTTTDLADLATVLWNTLEAILGPESMAQWAAMQRGGEAPS